MLKKLRKQLTGENWAWNNLNTLCWPVELSLEKYKNEKICREMGRKKSLEENNLRVIAFFTNLQVCKRTYLLMRFWNLKCDSRTCNWSCALHWPFLGITWRKRGVAYIYNLCFCFSIFSWRKRGVAYIYIIFVPAKILDLLAFVGEQKFEILGVCGILFHWS